MCIFLSNNREVLHLLEERGQAILHNDKTQKETIEEEIKDTITKKHELLTTPVAAFITFANEESYLKATDLNKVRVGGKTFYKKHWQGHPLYFKPALEPSSILWENQYVPQFEIIWKLTVSILILFLILMVSF